MDLKKVATLGAGAFGQVFLVKHNSQYYALKCLSKALVIETGLQVRTCSCCNHSKKPNTLCSSMQHLLIQTWQKGQGKSCCLV